MKRYLTIIFIFLSVIFIISGIRLDLYWSGIAGWGLAFVCLIFAAYYSKYIPNERKRRKSKL
ncbi:hypothetical protein [Oceanobacillus bengalensis]|uniref:Uncharacterized protein n=1 Tax=Oceanobacillus bengalensis TaxID=1435466 RepID=A0A494YSM6_9BACI|nr:hypothetical protein [Oceanobacillus bengalensis]RKQ12820.1 hypothetical protein D8M05_17735 [Oceanobacillus bengalensis]